MSEKNAIPKIVYIFAVFGSLAGMLYGYASGSISLALPSMADQFSAGTTIQGFLVSFMVLGALPALLVSTVLEKKIERRTLLIAAGIIFVVASIGCSLASTVYTFLLFRIVLGFSVGIANMYSLIYLVELAPSSIRGTVGAMYQLCVNIGIFISYMVGAHYSASDNWHAIMLVGAIPAVIFVMGMIVSPASPRWLIRDRQIEKARKILLRLRSNKTEVEEEIIEVKASLTAKEAGVKVLLKSYKPALYIVFILAFFQVFTGINAVIYYAPVVFQGLNMANAAIIANYAIGIALIAATFGSLFLVDKLGRRFLLITSFLMQVIPLVLIGMFPANGVLDVICVFMYIFAFSIGLGPVFGLYVPEAFPLHVRAIGCGIINFSQYFMNFILGSIFPSVFNKIGFNVFYIFAVLSLIAAIFVYYKLPETKSKTLEEIEKYWTHKAS